MNRSVRAAAGLLICAGICLCAPIPGHTQAVRSVRRVQVLGDRSPVEIEIESSDQLIPQTQILTNPDRLVLDFANAVPAAGLRNQTLHHGEVKGVRVGLFSAKPPVTRIVVDLNDAQGYQIFPSGRTVMVKVGAGTSTQASSSSASGPKLVNTTYPAQAVSTQSTVNHAEPAPAAPAQPPLTVSFKGGLLKVNANRASLSQVLFAIHERTGAEIAIPAGAEQEQVVADLGPAAAPEVLTHLLNGSKFNFLILSSASDPNMLDRVILSARPEGPTPAYHQPLAQVQEPEPEVPVQSPPPPTPDPAPEQQAPPPGGNANPPAGNEAPQ